MAIPISMDDAIALLWMGPLEAIHRENKTSLSVNKSVVASHMPSFANKWNVQALQPCAAQSLSFFSVRFWSSAQRFQVSTSHARIHTNDHHPPCKELYPFKTIRIFRWADEPDPVSPAPRIVGGYGIAIGALPFICTIRQRASSAGQWNQRCGGTVVNENRLLTSAHCIFGQDIARLLAVCGLRQVRTIQLVEIKPDYVHGQKGNDLALVCASITNSVWRTMSFSMLFVNSFSRYCWRNRWFSVKTFSLFRFSISRSFHPMRQQLSGTD